MEQSREWLAQSYLSLLKKSQDRDKISISEIASKAGVSRQTFYRHFQHTHEILDWYLEKQFTLFLEKSREFKEVKRYHFENLKRAMQFFTENENLLKILIAHKQEHLILEKLSIFTQRFSPSIIQGDNPVLKTYKEQAFAGSFYMLMKTWLYRKQKETPELLFQVILPFLL